MTSFALYPHILHLVAAMCTRQSLLTQASLGASIRPAIAIKVTPSSINFGELAPGQISEGHKGKLKPQPRQIIVRSINDLNSILTPERVKVLQTIRESAPQSISELAFLPGRDRRNVIHDLTYLKGSGFVDFEDENASCSASKSYLSLWQFR